MITDIEGSTQLSVAGRTVYDQLLAIHDQLIREGIAKFNGCDGHELVGMECRGGVSICYR